MSVLGGVTALVFLVSCGGEEGIEENAVVNVYASAEQCKAAGRNLEKFGGRAGELQVRVVCLEHAESGGRLDLATVGANARRAVEDSSSVAYIDVQGPATRFTEPILDEGSVALFQAKSGATSMGEILDLLASWDADEVPRETVWEGQ